MKLLIATVVLAAIGVLAQALAAPWRPPLIGLGLAVFVQAWRPRDAGWLWFFVSGGVFLIGMITEGCYLFH
jgi:hypothetical protein